MGEVGRRKIQVPRRTAQQVESVAISLEEAIKHCAALPLFFGCGQSTGSVG